MGLRLLNLRDFFLLWGLLTVLVELRTIECSEGNWELHAHLGRLAKSRTAFPNTFLSRFVLEPLSG